MKKFLFQIIFLISICQISKTQTTFGGTGFQVFNANDLSIPVCSNGKLFNNLNNDHEGFTYRPFGPGSLGNPRSLGYMCGLWLGGKDQNQVLHVSAPTYNNNGAIENSPGPFSTIADSNFYSKYDRLWRIRKTQIDSHIIFHATVGYVTPEVILNWPGNGNVQNGEAAKLAPFADFNNNNLYEPQFGETPLIKGDEAIFFMYNDQFFHEESGGISLDAEVHGLLYVFKNIEIEQLKSTAFLNYKIFNRSASNYTNFYASVFFDGDLGYYNDDYIGCDSTRSLGYFYKADADDETSFGFGLNPPALGVKTIGCPMFGFNGFGTEDLTLDFEALNYYNIQRGYKRNGTPIIYGGSILTEQYNTKFEYSDSPNQNNGWSEWQFSNVPGERRTVVNFGKSNLLAGDALTMDIAFFVTKPNSSGGQIASVDRLLALSDSIDAFINSKPSWEYYCNIGIQQISEIENIQTTISPNPSNSFVNFTSNLKGNEIVMIELYDLAGRKIDQITGKGNETITWNKGNLPPQIILAKISVDSKYSGTYKTVVF